MPRLLSGSALRAGGSNTYINLPNAMPQLPASETTATGFTVVTNSLLETSYRSSLGYLQFTTGTITNQLNRPIQIISTATSLIGVVISGTSVLITGTNAILANDYDTGNLRVFGTIGTYGLASLNDLLIGNMVFGTGSSTRALTNNSSNNFRNNISIQRTFGNVDNVGLYGEYSGVNNIVLGNGALKLFQDSYSSIAIGTNALSSGTSYASIAIGENSLANAGTLGNVLGTVTSVEYWGYTYTYNTVTQTVTRTPLVTPQYIDQYSSEYNGQSIIHVDVEIPDFSIVNIGSVGNYAEFGTRKITSGTYALYSILNLQNLEFLPNTFNNLLPGYIGKSVIGSSASDRNIAIGRNAGAALQSGIQNFFVGDNAAPNFVQGNYNFFFGPDVAQNMIQGNACISIGGDLMVDGVDNQVNIGGVFYYNGYGYLQLNADVGMGLGTTATSLTTASLSVLGGAYISNNIIVGSTSTSIDSNSGALVVQGGVGIAGNMHIDGLITGVITTSTNVQGGTRGAIPYQTSTGVTQLLSIGPSNTVLFSNGDLPIWKDINELFTSTNTTSTTATNIFVGTASNELYYFGLVDKINDYTEVVSTSSLVYNVPTGQLGITSLEASTNQTSGALIVSGGVGVGGSIYSADGSANDNYLLYVPRVFVQSTPPSNARIGEFWFDDTTGDRYQYIPNGSANIWVGI